MEVLAGVAVGCPGRLVDDVGRDGADLDEAVVLDEDGVARQIAVDDGRLGPLQRIGKETWLTISSHFGSSFESFCIYISPRARDFSGIA